MDCPADLASAAKQRRIRAIFAGGFPCYLRRANDGQIITARVASAATAFDAVEAKAAIALFTKSMERKGCAVRCVIC
jgi:hypothetical protein